MKKSMSGILSLTLILAMLISMVPFTFAQTANSAGTISETYDNEDNDDNDEGTENNVNVSATLTASPSTVYPGQTVNLTATATATVTGSDGTTTPLTASAAFKSGENTYIIPVDTAAGSLEITRTVTVNYSNSTSDSDSDNASTISGSKDVEASCTVTVKAEDYSISLSASSMTVYPGQTVSLPTATVLDSDGKAVENATVTWSGTGVSGTSFSHETTGSYEVTASATITDSSNVTHTLTATCNIAVTSPTFTCKSASAEINSFAKLEPSLSTDYTVKPSVSYTFSATTTSGQYFYSTESACTAYSPTPLIMTVTYTASLDNGKYTSDSKTAQISFYQNLDIEVTLEDSVSTFEFSDKSVLTDSNIALSTQITSGLNTTSDSYATVAFNSVGSAKTAAQLTMPTNTGASQTAGTTPLMWLGDVTLTVNETGENEWAFSYSVKSSSDSNLIYGTGTVTVNFNGNGSIVYKTDYATAVTFDEDDFEDFWDASDSVSGSLNYVVFGVSSRVPDYGNLYTTTTKTTSVTKSMKFMPGYTSAYASSYYDLDTVTYVPDSKETGAYTVEIPFTAYGKTTSIYLEGTVVIELNGGSGDINYSTDYKTAITFDEDDFEDFWDDSSSVSGNLGYVVFTSLPKYGTLYTTSSKSVKATTTSKFMYDYSSSDTGYYDLDKVYYVPNSSYTSSYTVEIPFIAYGGSNYTQKLSGTVAITLNGSGTSIYATGVIFGSGKTTIASQMATAYKNETDTDLAYVMFDLPDVEDGRLYYDYSTILDTDYVSAKSEYYVSPSSKQLDLDKVAFVPAAGRSGNVTISYTGYDTNGKNAKDLTLVLTVVAKTTSSDFSDVTTSYSWAADSIDFLAYQGVVQGSNGKYNPSASITRGDFMLMLYRAFLEDEYGDFNVTSNFADVTKGTSSYSKETYQAVGVAKYLGIAQGDGTNFKPTTSITREEAMTLIYRTLDEMDVGLEYTTKTSTSSFSDYSSVSSYAKSAITYLIQHGIVIGSNGKITPKSNITRAEMAVILHRVLTY